MEALIKTGDSRVDLARKAIFLAVTGIEVHIPVFTSRDADRYIAEMNSTIRILCHAYSVKYDVISLKIVYSRN